MDRQVVIRVGGGDAELPVDNASDAECFHASGDGVETAVDSEFFEVGVDIGAAVAAAGLGVCEPDGVIDALSLHVSLADGPMDLVVVALSADLEQLAHEGDVELFFERMDHLEAPIGLVGVAK